jgi:hypothetical protein
LATDVKHMGVKKGLGQFIHGIDIMIYWVMTPFNLVLTRLHGVINHCASSSLPISVVKFETILLTTLKVMCSKWVITLLKSERVEVVLT